MLGIQVVEVGVTEEGVVVEEVVEEGGTLVGLEGEDGVVLLGKTEEVIEGVGVVEEVKIWD